MCQIPASKGTSACMLLCRSHVCYCPAGSQTELVSTQPSGSGFGRSKSVLNDWSSCLCRKAFQLLRELVRQCPQDIREAVKQGLFGTLAGAIRSELADVREAALALLALLVQHPGAVTAAKQASSMAQSCSHRPPQGVLPVKSRLVQPIVHTQYIQL